MWVGAGGSCTVLELEKPTTSISVFVAVVYWVAVALVCTKQLVQCHLSSPPTTSSFQAQDNSLAAAPVLSTAAMAFAVSGCWLTGALPRAGRPATSIARPSVAARARALRQHAVSMTTEDTAAAATPPLSTTTPSTSTPVVNESAVAAVQDTNTTPASPAWMAAVKRLSAATPGVPMAEVEAALEESDGLEMKALEMLTAASARIAEREAQIADYRASGRISAMEEAALRRRVVGSAGDFFKSFVEVKGAHVDQGYVDESSDAMGKMGKAVQSFFGKFTKIDDAGKDKQ